ncbi:hypothetical protein E2C01_027432 [Portunus trituberculatus]|uniref:Uncharacterized protein n=1 Tax=Portunus trituberculatus TaxID=210409 RepID=A0A5B7ELL9_PORTR|nr:hypothetical protein [Portunus trituberculatus]
MFVSCYNLLPSHILKTALSPVRACPQQAVKQTDRGRRSRSNSFPSILTPFMLALNPGVSPTMVSSLYPSLVPSSSSSTSFFAFSFSSLTQIP